MSNDVLMADAARTGFPRWPPSLGDALHELAQRGIQQVVRNILSRLHQFAQALDALRLAELAAHQFLHDAVDGGSAFLAHDVAGPGCERSERGLPPRCCCIGGWLARA